MEKELKEHNIRPTSVRLLVYKKIKELDHTFSLSDLEKHFDSVGKSSLFRTLTVFEEKGLLHSMEDGSGQRKYCFCSGCHHHATCNHIHFYCRVCGKNYCLKNVTIPVIPIPEGYIREDSDYIVKGVCSHCSSKMKVNDMCSCHHSCSHCSSKK